MQLAQPLHILECLPGEEQCTRSRQAFDTAPEQVLEPNNIDASTKQKLFETIVDSLLTHTRYNT